MAVAARATVQYGWPSFFKSRPCVCILYTIQAIDPPERRLLTKMHLVYSSPRATLLHPVLLLLLPPSSVPLFRPVYKVSSRFNPKDTSHGKYSLIATFRCVVLVFFMHGHLLLWFFMLFRTNFCIKIINPFLAVSYVPTDIWCIKFARITRRIFSHVCMKKRTISFIFIIVLLDK